MEKRSKKLALHSRHRGCCGAARRLAFSALQNRVAGSVAMPILIGLGLENSWF
jgi:hypothetical protein